MVLAKLREGPGESAVLFSGDLGRRGTPMLNDPAAVSDADWLVLESTYGDRLHTETDRKEALGRIVRQALGKGGVLLIPAFAVERTQEILYILNVLGEARDIPSVPIYIDSPMAVDVTKIFSRYEQTFDDEARRIISTGEKVLDVENLHYCSTVEESKSLNKRQGPMIIISASGMAVGGRVLHHLKHRLPDRRNTVLLVGYQAVATRGRSLQEGAKKIRIHGEEVPVRASIVSLDGFSSHADYNEILHWLANFRNAPRTLLVHGEDSAQAALKARIEEKYGWEVAIPAYLDEVPL
jgi:metallo-beta-lactamase family protein